MLNPCVIVGALSLAEWMLDRKEFYKLAHECRDYALRLANHDQDAVDRAVCREFNEFRERVRGYDRLAGPLADLRPALPITRVMVTGATLALWLVLTLVVSRLVGRIVQLLIFSSTSLLVLLVVMIPPRIYGTSVEAIEGRVMVVVKALEQLLENGEMAFSEAAFFVVRDVLREASDELRQQVYLSRVSRWRRGS